MDGTKRKKERPRIQKRKKVKRARRNFKILFKNNKFLSKKQPSNHKDTENTPDSAENENTEDIVLSTGHTVEYSEPQSERVKDSENTPFSAENKDTGVIVLTTSQPSPETFIEKDFTHPPSVLQEQTESQKEKDYFVKPNLDELSDFFRYQPYQPKEDDLPFLEKKTIFTVKK
ncbi:hypothetical protein J6590_068535 [Homalodisca vitripennis]|nr:hypothetical protein J6590_068535 [Homalodisca vitripennis]